MEKVHVAGLYLVVSIVMLVLPHEGFSLNVKGLCDRTEPSQRIALLDNAMNELSDRYDVRNGLAMLTECDPQDPNMPESCKNFNNPSLYYGGTSTRCSQIPCAIETPPSFIPGSSMYSQPSKSDANLVFGCLPPPCMYFSIREYLYERGLSSVNQSGNGGSDNDGGLQRPPDPTDPLTRVVVDTVWFDSYNHLNIKCTAAPGTQKFGAAFAHISTANRNVAKDIKEALVSKGFPASAINVDGIPNNWAVLEGATSDRDSFRTVVRVAKPCDNPQSCDEYTDLTNFNLLVRSVRPKSNVPSPTFDPFPQPEPTDRTTGTTENSIVGDNAMRKLLAAVSTYYGKPQYRMVGQAKNFSWEDCISKGDYCWGENFDTAYVDFTKPALIRPQSDDFIVVCGGNHIELEYSVYTSVGLFNPEGLATGLIEDSDKVDSASCYSPDLDDQTSKQLYCVEVRAEGKCPQNGPCVELSNADFPQVYIQNRINLHPTTMTGPDPSELIMPVLYGYIGSTTPPITCPTSSTKHKSNKGTIRELLSYMQFLMTGVDT